MFSNKSLGRDGDDSDEEKKADDSQAVVFSTFALGTGHQIKSKETSVHAEFGPQIVTNKRVDIVGNLYNHCASAKDIVNGPGALGTDVNKLVNSAFENFMLFVKKHPDTPIVWNLIGFSRGATNTRRLVNKLVREQPALAKQVVCNIIGLDPVAGLTEKSNRAVIDIPSCVHGFVEVLVANDQRLNFKPQDITRTKFADLSKTKVCRLITYGIHSDVSMHKAINDDQESNAKQILPLCAQLMNSFGTNIPVATLSASIKNEQTKAVYNEDVIVLHNQDTEIEALNSFSKQLAAHKKYKSYGYGRYDMASGGKRVTRHLAHERSLYVEDSDFFMNQYHRELFKKHFPASFNFYFEQAIQLEKFIPDGEELGLYEQAAYLKNLERIMQFEWTKMTECCADLCMNLENSGRVSLTAAGDINFNHPGGSYCIEKTPLSTMALQGAAGVEVDFCANLNNRLMPIYRENKGVFKRREMIDVLNNVSKIKKVNVNADAQFILMVAQLIHEISELSPKQANLVQRELEGILNEYDAQNILNRVTEASSADADILRLLAVNTPDSEDLFELQVITMRACTVVNNYLHYAAFSTSPVSRAAAEEAFRAQYDMICHKDFLMYVYGDPAGSAETYNLSRIMEPTYGDFNRGVQVHMQQYARNVLAGDLHTKISNGLIQVVEAEKLVRSEKLMKHGDVTYFYANSPEGVAYKQLLVMSAASSLKGKSANFTHCLLIAVSEFGSAISIRINAQQSRIFAKVEIGESHGEQLITAMPDLDPKSLNVSMCESVHEAPHYKPIGHKKAKESYTSTIELARLYDSSSSPSPSSSSDSDRKGASKERSGSFFKSKFGKKGN